jgi:hypothetical protein
MSSAKAGTAEALYYRIFTAVVAQDFASTQTAK